MAHILTERVADTTSTTGTGALSLDGADLRGFQNFDDVCANGDTIYYSIAHRTLDQWEVGLGTFGAGANTLTRTSVLSSSNSGSAVNFSSGAKDIVGSVPASVLSTILDADLTALAGLTRTRGDLIVGGASAWTDLALGTSGYQLQSDGTDAVWAGFTQAGSGASTRTWSAKAREARFSVTDFGAVGDDSTDCTTAFANAYTAIVARGGGVLFVPAGIYRVSSLPNLAANNITIEGEGDFATGSVIRNTSTTGNLWTISGQHVRLEGLYFKPTVRMTSGYMLVFASGCFLCSAERIRIDYGYDGIHISDASETRLTRVSMRYMLGINGLYLTGTAGVGSYRTLINDFLANNPYPQTYGTVKAWATATAYSLNDIVQVNGRVYQCSTAGTSSGAGSGPSGLPSGSTPDSAFTATITDGTAVWKFVAQQGLAWVTQDNYHYSVVGSKVVCINGDVGFRMIDSAASSSQPQWIFLDDLETDHCYSNGVQLTRGNGVYATNCWIGSSLTGSGVLYGANYGGETSWTTSRITANWKHGVELVSGPVDNIFSGCFFGANSQAGSNTYDGISVGANATRFQIIGCKSGAAVGIGSNPQRYGIAVESGTSDNYSILGNVLLGNTTGALLNSGSGTAVAVWGNTSHSSNSVPGSIAYAQGAITTDLRGLAGTVTWNEGSTQFFGWHLAVTDSASAATSRLIRATVGGTEVFGVRKDGLIFNGDSNHYWFLNSGNPLINFDSTDYFAYNRSSNYFQWVVGGTERLMLDANGQPVFTSGTTTPVSLGTNTQWTLTPTSNTNFRISYRGSDGVTRVGNITLA
jgi:hypothetical protein